MLKKLVIKLCILLSLTGSIFINQSYAKEAFSPAENAKPVTIKPVILAQKDETAKDPFVPYMLDSSSTGNIGANGSLDLSTNSKFLSDRPLGAYNLTGIIASKHKSIAILKSRDKREYFAKIGDKIGNENGTISSINKDGIVVSQSGATIDINVSNQFEIKGNEK